MFHHHTAGTGRDTIRLYAQSWDAARRETEISHSAQIYRTKAIPKAKENLYAKGSRRISSWSRLRRRAQTFALAS